MTAHHATLTRSSNLRHSSRRTRVACRAHRSAGAAGRLALAFLMIAASAVAITGHGSPAAGVDVTHFETIAVSEGGSLWQIAAEHPVEGLGTSETVELIRSANRLDTAVVHVGQTIRVPAQAPFGTSLASR